MESLLGKANAFFACKYEVALFTSRSWLGPVLPQVMGKKKWRHAMGVPPGLGVC